MNLAELQALRKAHNSDVHEDLKGHTAGFASSAGKAAVHGRHLPTVLLETGCENVQIIMADGRIPRIVAAMSKV